MMKSEREHGAFLLPPVTFLSFIATVIILLGLSESGDICSVSLTASQTLITQPSLKLHEGCF